MHTISTHVEQKVRTITLRPRSLSEQRWSPRAAPGTPGRLLFRCREPEPSRWSHVRRCLGRVAGAQEAPAVAGLRHRKRRIE